jgi:hypothetical protein
MTIFRNRADYKDIALSFCTYNNGPKTLSFSIGDTNGNSHGVASSTVFSLMTWYHITASYDGSVIRLYVNGVLDASKTESFSVPWNSSYHNTCIGDNSYDTGYEYSFHGLIDEFKIYGSAVGINDLFATPSQNTFGITADPNPVSSKADIYFTLPSNDKAAVFITDINGYVIKEFTGFSKGQNKLTFEVPASLKQGVYFLHINAESYSEVKRLMIFK